MLPSKTAKIGNFTYKVFQSKYTGSDHGETDIEGKDILIHTKKNQQCVQDTVLHEFLHAMFEDLFEAVNDIESLEKKEESFNRLFTPRLLQFMQDNPKWIQYLCQRKKRS